MSLASSIDTGKDYVFANLHGRWSGFLRGEELGRIVQSASPDLLSRALASHEMPVVSYDHARQELVKHLGAELAQITGRLDRATGGVLPSVPATFLVRGPEDDPPCSRDWPCRSLGGGSVT